MAQVLVQGRLFPCPSSSFISMLPHHNFFLCSNLSSSLPEAQLPVDSEFTTINKETKLLSSRKCLKPCRSSVLPQRPFGEPQRSRQDPAGRGAMKPELNSLKPQKHVPASREIITPSPLMRSTTLEQPSICNTFSPPSHVPPASFLSRPLELQVDTNPNDNDDKESVKRSAFSMALAICAAVQLINITDALGFWLSRLRLRYFDSPFKYREVSMRSKLGRVGIFWDIENCPIPGNIDAEMVVKQMHRIGTSFGNIQCLRAYGKLEYLTRQAPCLLSMGVELCPVPDGKESADKAIIMDALLFAFDHKPCPDTPAVEKLAPQASQGDGIMLVTGDRGFSALLRELSNRQMTTVVVGNGHQKIPPILAQAADYSVQWHEMMETKDLTVSCDSRSSLVENISFLEDEQLEIGGWDASSSCNVLLNYESQTQEGILLNYNDYETEEEDSQNSDGVVPNAEKEFACSMYTEIRAAKNFNLLDMAAPEEGLGNVSESHASQQSKSLGNGLLRCTQFLNLESGEAAVPKDIFSMLVINTEGSTSSSLGKGSDAQQRRIGLEFRNNEGLGTTKILAPVGGRVRILRHLRCEIAYVIEKHCKGRPKGCLSVEQFELLYELEMGQSFVSSQYGFASLKSLLQSMPDIVCLRSVSSNTAEWRISPYVKRNRGDQKTRINYSREDLRCILYKILHTVWPHGVPKEQLSSEHCKLTGRPLVLVAYEYWKLSDMIQSMGDMMYIDVENKHMYLIDGTCEPQGLHGRAKNGWN